MDIDLILQDADQMIPLKLFLGSIESSNPALAKLRDEILTFKGRIETLVAASRKE